MNTTTATPSSPSATSDGKESLAHSLRHMVDEADQFLKAAARSGDEKFDTARDKLLGQIREMRAQLDELEDTAAYKARKAARAADQAAHSHPYGAMGIAAAAGLLIGFLAARR
ncbi:MAG TPA: hypothetical protein VJ743_10515 [Albitalea sp.]|nr:hypothetical protein [Albitalea sp.]